MMQKWFKDAKLGIFIHYGIYAVDGTSESWALYWNECTPEKYYSQADRFNTIDLKMDYWAKIIKESGARYAVLTAKHHDGFCLWDTSTTTLSIKNHGKSNINIAKDFVTSMKKNNINAGIYFSLLDWSHKDYPTLFHPYPEKFPKTWGLNIPNNLNFPRIGGEDEGRWNNFLKFLNTQLIELSGYKPDLLWFDGDWTRSPEQWHSDSLYNNLQKMNKDIVMNSRFCRDEGYGDYDNPEQDIPIDQPKREWELCLTMNDSWGYRPHDQNWKSFNKLLRSFVEVISLGGNLLLNIGPRMDGWIPEQAQLILKSFGEFTAKYGEAIYETTHGLPLKNSRTHSTISRCQRKIYFFQFGSDNTILIKGLNSIPVKSYDLLNKSEVKFTYSTSNDHGYKFVWLDLSNIVMDNDIRVICVEFDEKISYF